MLKTFNLEVHRSFSGVSKKVRTLVYNVPYAIAKSKKNHYEKYQRGVHEYLKIIPN